MAQVQFEYRPNLGRGSGIDVLLHSPQMERFMASVGRNGVTMARSAAPNPNTITTRTHVAFGRWCVIVRNESDTALREEYGGRYSPAYHPLARVLTAAWVADPKRRLGFRTRLS